MKGEVQKGVWLWLCMIYLECCMGVGVSFFHFDVRRQVGEKKLKMVSQ